MQLSPVAGIDVSKATLDAFILPHKTHQRVAYTQAAVLDLGRHLL